MRAAPLPPHQIEIEVRLPKHRHEIASIRSTMGAVAKELAEVPRDSPAAQRLGFQKMNLTSELYRATGRAKVRLDWRSLSFVAVLGQPPSAFLSSFAALLGVVPGPLLPNGGTRGPYLQGINAFRARPNSTSTTA